MSKKKEVRTHSDTYTVLEAAVNQKMKLIAKIIAFVL